LFIGRFEVVVDGGLVRLPSQIVEVLGDAELQVELVPGEPPVLMAVPLASLAVPIPPRIRCPIDRDGGMRLPDPLVRAVRLDGRACIEGMGEYLFIRPLPAPET